MPPDTTISAKRRKEYTGKCIKHEHNYLDQNCTGKKLTLIEQLNAYIFKRI